MIRPVLVGPKITAARARPGGTQLELVIGRAVEAVEARGKHLLIGFDNGLTLHTHLGMHGSWHRYRRGEPWRRAASRAVAVLETAESVAVCFDAPTVELLETRAVAIHPGLRGLGSDVGADDFDIDAALDALRARGDVPIGDALLDQRAVAGLGNVYRSELCFLERVYPFTPVSAVSDDALRGMLERGHQLLRANSAGGARVTTTAGTAGSTHVYGRAGRPCHRCGTPIRSAASTTSPGAAPRRVYWCTACQPLEREEIAPAPAGRGR